MRVLTNQLQAAKRAHRHETDQLRQQLATATGEILLLREPGTQPRNRRSRQTRWRVTVTLFEQTLTDTERLLGPDHPITSTIRKSLGNVPR
jgi:hypothetical protein